MLQPKEKITNEFGLTNDPAYKSMADAFREAAIADGWECKPGINKDEPITSNAVLERDGFIMHITARDDQSGRYYGPRWRYQVGIDIWGPDGLVIKPPDEYNWEKIKAGVTTCNLCGKTEVATERYSFAGRSCADCLPKAQAEFERPGWTT